ncbi:MAG: FAD-binding oxidoreductase [Rhodospirillales bacterium]
MSASLPEGLLERLTQALGPQNVLTAPEDLAPYLHEWRGIYQGAAAAVLRPGSTDETAAVVGLCAEAGCPITPQGGNTGLVGGAVAEGGVILSLGRINRIREIDAAACTITVEAGCVLADVQTAAREAGRLFPLSLGAEGTCQIGGNLSSNAGGMHVLRYGNMRDLTLGLEVVLPDGRIWNGLRALRKDNTGYALKHLFIGAEGTLGVITAAVLKLFPRPTETQTAFCALPSAAAAIALLERCMDAAGDALNAFEASNRTGVALAESLIEDVSVPLAEASPFYALIEFAASGGGGDLRGRFESVLGAAMEAGEVTDAAIAETEAQTAKLWRIREGITQSQIPAGLCAKHDVSVPISSIPAFLERAEAAVLAASPDARIVAYGHFGDGNIHYNAVRPEADSDAAFRPLIPAIRRAVHDIVMDMNGSFSAEHGVGMLKRDELTRCRTAAEIDLMRTLKTAFDPKGVLNPGKILEP